MRFDFFMVSIVGILLFLNIAFLQAQYVGNHPSNFYEANAGTAENPYLVSDLSNLMWLSCSETAWLYHLGNHYLQTADIDASETKTWFGGIGFSAIGGDFQGATVLPFRGVYDGNGFAITNLYVNYFGADTAVLNPRGSMLFGMLSGAVVKNVRLENITAYLQDAVILGFGGLANTASRSIISNCSVSGNIYVTGNRVPRYIGGLVGNLGRSTLENSFFYGDISNPFESIPTGGLVGVLRGSSVKYCYVASNDGFTNIASLVDTILPIDGEDIPTLFHNVFWDVDTTGVLEPFNEIVSNNVVFEHVKGFSSSEMKQAPTFIENGWDFVNIWDINPDTNAGYPFIQPMPPPKDLKCVVEENSNTVVLEWENPFLYPTGYLVYRDEEPLVKQPIKETTFIEFEVPNGEFVYSVYAVYPSGVSNPASATANVDILSDFYDDLVHSKTVLIGNHPNPFNPETTIRLFTEKSGNASIVVYNVKGQKIKTLMDGFLVSGNHSLVWNGTNDNDDYISSGVYFYMMKTDEYTTIKKMILMK